jgi:hypothetical protein
VALVVADALEAGGVRYLVGGSMASSFSGQPRSTVDLFIAGGTPPDAEQMERRQRIQVSADPERHLYFYTPEDILLQKLRWYRLGQEVSDRQWRDVLGILLVQGKRLDEDYLRRGADVLGVAALLERALQAVPDR